MSLNLEELAGQEQDENTIILPEPSSPWPTPQMPRDQIAYQEWLLTDASIFQCDSLPDSPIFTLDAPAVKGFVIYGARCGTVKFYAAWDESTGTLVGWLKVQPAVEGVDSNHGTGEVLGRPLFMGITDFAWQTAKAKSGTTLSASTDSGVILDLSGHDAIDRFSTELKKAAWDLGVDGG